MDDVDDHLMALLRGAFDARLAARAPRIGSRNGDLLPEAAWTPPRHGLDPAPHAAKGRAQTRSLRGLHTRLHGGA